MNRRHGTHVIIGAITPAYDAIDADTLTYPNLRLAFKSQSLPSFVLRSSKDMVKDGFRFSPAVLKEEWRSTYLINVSYRLQKAWTLPEKIFWSSQFTSTSVKLFGKPLSREVSSIASGQLAFFEATMRTYDLDPEFAAPVMTAYRSLAQTAAAPRTIEERYRHVLDAVREYYEATYADCLKVFDDYDPRSTMAPEDIADAFSRALEILKARDVAWQKWEVVMSKESKLSVNVYKRKIIVGRRRAALFPSAASGLFAHEVLVHALRAVNGEKLHKDLRMGLPGYLDAEEGLGVLVESAVTGRVPDKVIDRYVDIALALGAWNRPPLRRNEMYLMCFTRAVMRSIASDEPIDFDELEKVIWEHVNRIYRGSLGNKYVAVFTKDIAYYQGFVKIARYLDKASLRSDLLCRRLERISQGKYDPTNKKHRQTVQQCKH